MIQDNKGQDDERIYEREIFGKRIFLAAIIIAAIAVSLTMSGCASQKEEAPKVYHVGILSGLSFFGKTVDGFKSGMASLGYIEGENIVYDVQETNFSQDAYRKILQKFVDDKVDLIFVYPTEAAQEAKAVTQGAGIPVLFAHSGIENTDLVDSVREPGGDITGVRLPAPDLAAKHLEILLELDPKIKRVCVTYLRGYPLIPSEMEALNETAKLSGVTLVEAPADNSTELEAWFAAREKSDDIGFDAILMIPEPLDAFPAIATFAYKHRLPFGGATNTFGNYSSIFGFMPDNAAVGKLAAPMADKILKGTPAGTIPVVSPEGYLLIDVKAAEQLGVTVPESLLSQANEIIR